MNHKLVALTALGLVLAATFVARGFRGPAATEPPTSLIPPNSRQEVGITPTGQGEPTPAATARPADLDCPASTHPIPALPDREQPAIDARRAQRYSPFREFSPFDEIDRAVALSPEQRPAIEALVSDRETLMTSAYSDAVLDRQDCAAGAEEVRRIYLDFDDQIRRSLTPDQQALYDTARVEGRIGAPMFVFRYGQ